MGMAALCTREIHHALRRRQNQVSQTNDALRPETALRRSYHAINHNLRGYSFVLILGIHGFAFHKSKNRGTFLSEPSLVWSEWRAILDRRGDRTQILGIRSFGLSGSGTGPLLLFCFISISLQAFTRQTRRLNQMGSVIRCYYSTDRAHFSSWPYQGKERAESSLLYLEITAI